MTDMLEIVARAICNGSLRPIAGGECDGPDCSCWPSYVEDAKAAIEAMREPTDEMKSAGDSMMPLFAEGGVMVTGYDVAGEVWTAMADAALKGKE